MNHQLTSWHHVIRAGIGLSLLVGLLVTAFGWPAANSEPRDVPLAVAGPPAAVEQVAGQLESVRPGWFDVEPAADADEALALIADREVYGAVILAPDGPPQVLTASAASRVVADVLEALAGQLGGDGPPATGVQDVVPLPDDDPRGAGFTASALPIVLGGLIVGVALSLAVTGVGRRTVSALIAASAAGLVVALVTQPWLGVLEGNYLANAGIIALTIAAISLTIVGLNATLGLPGIALGGLTMLLLGNPLSGVTSAPEMLPSGWGALGQLLPPGAGANLLRSAAFFDGAAVAGPLLVLTGWLAVAAILLVIGAKLRRVPGAGPEGPLARGEATAPATPAAR
ncbi:hypothetical protein [Phytoactinopolyspora limicola]|uniref:hypothetical protein n=1 Tax=Phytoactinopolyspora limicola TaxID=2715536 RepID=UPI001A9C48B0|nr:hypothetical protein [Phytoactinopolyspora limicola]